MGASPKTTVFLKECMADALLKAMNEKPFEKITVDALTFKLICLWERWADTHALAERRRYDPENAETFFDFNHSIRDTLSVICAAGLQTCIYDAFCRVMMPPEGAGAAACYEAQFYSYGLFGFLDEWIRRGFRETPGQLARLFRQITLNREKL